jgi:hypothetical protein
MVVCSGVAVCLSLFISAEDALLHCLSVSLVSFVGAVSQPCVVRLALIQQVRLEIKGPCCPCDCICTFPCTIILWLVATASGGWSMCVPPTLSAAPRLVCVPIHLDGRVFVWGSLQTVDDCMDSKAARMTQHCAPLLGAILRHNTLMDPFYDVLCWTTVELHCIFGSAALGLGKSAILDLLHCSASKFCSFAIVVQPCSVAVTWLSYMILLIVQAT